MKNFIKKDRQSVDVGLEISLIHDGDYIVAYCSALELSSFGKTEKEAKESFDEALRIFVEYCLENGTLEKNLLNLGWSLRQKPTVKYQPPKMKRKKYPINILHSTIKKQFAIPL